MINQSTLNRAMQLLFWWCVAIILLLATKSINQPIPQVIFWDKLNHFMAFFVLFILLDLAYPWQLRFKVKCLIGFGFLIEIVQSFIPYREFSLWDVVADCIGIAAYFVVLKPNRYAYQQLQNCLCQI